MEDEIQRYPQMLYRDIDISLPANQRVVADEAEHNEAAEEGWLTLDEVNGEPAPRSSKSEGDTDPRTDAELRELLKAVGTPAHHFTKRPKLLELVAALPAQ